MKKLLFLLVFLSVFFKSQDIILGNVYYCSADLTENPDEIELQTRDAITVGSYYISLKDGKLESGDQGSFCGLDCLKEHYGTYEISADKISMKIDSTYYRGQCGSRKDFQKNEINLGDYHVVKFPTSIVLTKNPMKVPRKDYFKNLKLKFPKQKLPNQEKVMARYRDLYNGAIQARKDKAKPGENLLKRSVLKWIIYCDNHIRQEDLALFYRKIGYDLLQIIEKTN